MKEKLTKKELKHFQERLLEEKAKILDRFNDHIDEANLNQGPMADEADLAEVASNQAVLLRLADKERKLLNEINHALNKIKDGEYGICEGTGDFIGLKRLEIRPWTRYSIVYKERLEKEKRSYAKI